MHDDGRLATIAGHPAALGLLLLAAPLIGVSLTFPLIGLSIAIVASVLAAAHLGAPIGRIVVLGFVLTIGLNLTDIATSRLNAPSPAKYLFGLMLALVVMKAIEARRLPAVHAPGLAAIMIYCAASSATVVTAFDSVAALAALDELVRNVGVAVVMAILLSEPRMLRGACAVLLCALAALAAISTWQVATGAYDNDFYGFASASVEHIAGRIDSYRIAGPFLDPNSFGRILLIGAPFAVYEFVHGRLVLHRILAAGALGVLLAALIFTYSRGALFALLLMMILLALRMRAFGRHLIVLLVLCAVVTAGMAPDILLDRLWAAVDLVAGGSGGATGGPGGDESIHNRLDEMLLAVRMFADHPISGVGLGNYPLLFQQYAIEATAVFRHEDRLAHSRFLEVAAEQGLLGLAAFTAVLWTAARSLSSSARISSGLPRREADLAYVIGLALLGYLAASVFLHEDYPRFFWLLIGMSFAVPVAFRNFRK